MSRLSLRLMAFNLLLVFLPVAGILYLDVYEQHLVEAEQRALVRVGWVLATALPTTMGADDVQRALHEAGIMDVRLRVVDRGGRVIADSYHYGAPPPEARAAVDEIRENWVYRLGAFLLRKPMQILKPREPVPETANQYETASTLGGEEVEAALSGTIGLTKRAGGGRILLYAAVPVRKPEVIGAVVASEPTSRVLQDLYAVRLGISQIFLASVCVAILLSIWIGATIVRPLHALRVDAHEILDQSGRLRGRFRAIQRRDEIGDLARALERLTQRLEGHQVVIESFASDVSHELKNPLASIRNATELLASVSDPVERGRFLSVIEKEVARMEMLLSTLREVTRIDAQIAREERQEVRLAPLLSQIVEGFQMREKEAMRFELSATDVAVRATGERLIQIVENLLDNAASFSPYGGEIRIEAFRDRSDAVLRVSDEGPGIPEEHLKRIFDRFFTYRPASRGEHTGLGLAIVKAIVDGYGGRVGASNRATGGATVEVRLPNA